MDADQHGVDHIHSHVLHIGVPQGIGPHGALLGADARRGGGGDYGIFPIIGLIAAGLDAVAGQKGVGSPLGAAGAALDDELGVFGEDAVQPGQVGAVMAQKSVAQAVTAALGAHACLNVVVHLDVTHAVLADQAVHHTRGVLTHGGIGEIQLIPSVVNDPLAVAQEKPVVRQNVGQGTLDAHYLDLQPKSRHHALGADVVQRLTDTAGESGLGGQPFPYAVPPRAIGIPAAVDAVILTPRSRRRVDQREQLLCGGISAQAVHEIVEDHGQSLVIRILTADGAAVLGHFGQSPVEAARREGHRRRSALKGLPGGQPLPPARGVLAGSRQKQVQLSRAVSDLPHPGAVMFDLPHQGSRGRGIFKVTCGQVFVRGEGARTGDQQGLDGEAAHLGESQLGDGMGVPLGLAQPGVVGDGDPTRSVPRPRALLRDAEQDQGGHKLQGHLTIGAILHGGVGADGRRLGIKDHMGGHVHPVCLLGDR